MKLIYQIEVQDIKRVKEFFDSQKDSVLVKNRISRNVQKNIPAFSKDLFWTAMVGSLITIQQRSGPYSIVTDFMLTKPFPLNYEQCISQKDLKQFISEILSQHHLRRGYTIGEEIEENYSWLIAGGWIIIEKMTETLMDNQNASMERETAEFIIKNLKGFGPKQARNLLQSLGLTKYEIPIDSRITKWLTEFGFPIKLSASALGDGDYYNFVLDGFQKICEMSGIFPCVMDAAIFSSYDEKWPEDRFF